MANIRCAATVTALQAETGMSNGEAAILAGYFSIGDGGGGTVWFSTFIVTSRKIIDASGTPIQITTQVPHGLTTGKRVMIAGVGGNTAANGTWLIASGPGPKTFALNGSTSSAPYTSGGAVGDGGYTFPSASGTVGIWTRANESEVSANAKWFGARADGTTDDTAAIQACIDAAAADGGGIVYLPVGVYKVTGKLTISADSILICGAGRDATIIQFAPATHPGTLFLFEKTGVTPTLLYCGLKDLTIACGADSVKKKLAVDVHDVRYFICQNVVVRSWTGNGSIGFKVRGRDGIDFDKLHLTADIPIMVSKNDDGAGAYRDNKDIDHWRILNSELAANDVTGSEKLVVKFEDAVVLRNVTFRGNAWVQGGLGIVDTTAPRRRSVNLRLSDIRVEGIGATSGYAVDIQRHTNGKLRSLVIDNVNLGEGSDARYAQLTGGAAIGAQWNGIRANGVLRVHLDEVSYGGEQIPICYDGRLVASGGQFTHEDNGRAVPETEQQWDILGIARPRSWWRFSNASGVIADRQDENVSPFNADRNLSTNGSPVYQQFADGWDGYHLKFTEATDQHAALSTTLSEFSPQDRSATWLAYYTFPGGWNPGGDRVLMTLGSADLTGTNGPVVYINSSGQLKTYAGSGVATGTRDYRGKSVAILAVYNRTAGTWVVYAIAVGDATVETITGTYSASVGNHTKKGFGAPPQAFLRFAAIWFNADAESLGSATLTKLKWL
jgi:Pectate lyase superfamily protein